MVSSSRPSPLGKAGTPDGGYTWAAGGTLYIFTGRPWLACLCLWSGSKVGRTLHIRLASLSHNLRNMTMHSPNTFLTSIALNLFLATAVLAQTTPSTNIEQAVSFLRSACVTGGSSIDIKVTGDGGLLLRNVLASGVKGTVSVTKKELEGLADAASAAGAQQASEMRSCMKPYIDKILTALLSQGSAAKPEAITINADGNYFISTEFDKVVAIIANAPTRYFEAGEISKQSGISTAKVLLYIVIAKENGLGRSRDMQDLKIEPKGIRYALTKGLVN